MKKNSSLVVVGLDSDRLLAVEGVVEGDRVRVVRWCEGTRPESVGAEDSQAVGQWLARTLTGAGISPQRLTVALPRGEVVLKTLNIPRPQSKADVADLASIVRLQVLRQLTVAGEGAAIDFLEMPTGEDGGASMSLLAVALPADRLAWWQAVAAGAGAKIECLSLRSFGGGALLMDYSQRRDGYTIGVGIGPASTEILVMKAGRLFFARSLDARTPTVREEEDAFTEKLATEVKRTWVTYLASVRDAGDADGACVLGKGRLAELAAQRIGAAIGRRAETVETNPSLELPGGLPESLRAWAMSLSGLLLESLWDVARIDLVHPRHPQDVGAKLRQGALAAMLGLVVLGGVGYVAADQSLGGLQKQLDELTSTRNDLVSQCNDLQVREARVSHADRWRTDRIDWVAHLNAVTEVLPPDREAAFDEITVRSRRDVSFRPKDAKRPSYPNGTWNTTFDLTMSIGGTMERRQVIADLREQLLAGGVYKVDNRGPDTAQRFSLELTTSVPAPKPAPEPTPPGAAPPASAPGTNGGAK